MIALIEQRNAIAQEDRSDSGLLVSNELIELTLPILVRVAHTHADAIGHARPVSLLKQRHDRKRLFRLLRVIAGQWTPQYSGIDGPITDVIDHCNRGRIKPRIDYERIRLGFLNETVEDQIGCRRSAGDHANSLVLKSRIREGIDPIQPATRPENQRIRSVVIWICNLNNVIALGHAHDDVALVDCQCSAYKSWRVWEPRERYALAQFFRK